MTNNIAFPPNNIHEMTESVRKVDNKKYYFGENLFVITENSGMVPEEYLATITNTFISLASKMEHNANSISQLHDFKDTFSTFCERLTVENQLSKHTSLIIHSIKRLIHKFIKDFCENELMSNDGMQLLLITDVDGDRGTNAALVRRACRYINQEIPLIIPYTLLSNILEASFLPSPPLIQEEPECKRTYIISACLAIQNISNEKKWALFQSTTGEFIALLPPQFESKFNLSTYRQANFADVKTESILRSVGKPHTIQELACHEIVEILSSPTQKHVLWTGHGSIGEKNRFNKKSEAMGLTLDKVSGLINQIPSVTLWDLHTCYLLGNIRQLMTTVDNPNSMIIVNNGKICPSRPTYFDGEYIYTDCIKGYFYLCSRAQKKGLQILQENIGKISPLINGFREDNHPHIISRGSKKIVPVIFPGVIEKISNVEALGNALECERLYVDKLMIETRMVLPGIIRLLPGLGERNTSHLFKEVATTLSFEKFVLSAFDSYQDGSIVFMIGRLDCSDGLFEQIIHCVRPPQSNAIYGESVILAKKENRYLFFKINPYCNRIDAEHFSDDREKFMLNVMVKSCPSAVAFESSQIDPRFFYESVQKIFDLSDNWVDTVMDEFPPQKISPDEAEKESIRQFVTHYACYSEENAPFFQALVSEDREAVAALYPNQNLLSVSDALLFCIGRNLFGSFSQLINLMGKLDRETNRKLLVECLQMNRMEMINFLNLSEEFSLRLAARYGNPESFNRLLKEKKVTPDFHELLSCAKKTHNWEMVHELTLLKENSEKFHGIDQK